MEVTETLELDRIICGDNVTVLKGFPDACIDLTVTSPPYDNLRKYKGYSFDFEGVASQLWRVTKPGGVVVWVVGDQTVDGDEQCTPFKQALHFKEIGFNLHDTMIYAKHSCHVYDPRNKRYKQGFEFMFVLAKGRVITYNPIHDVPVKHIGGKSGTKRDPNGSLRVLKGGTVQAFQARMNVWLFQVGFMKSTKDREAFRQPAIFPEALARDHILSWSNPGDVVLDPFSGSGTTAKMSLLNDRHYIGIDVADEYCEIARQRIANAVTKRATELQQLTLAL